MRFTPRLVLTSLLAASYVSATRLVSRQSSTGESKCFESMCVGAVVTGSQVQYTLTSTGVRTVGWMAMGWGTRMAGSEMVVVWPNSDGTFTLSQRTGSGQVLPAVTSSPARVAALDQSASDVTASKPKFVFTMPVSTVGTENIIYAFGTTNPGSTSPSASFTEHWDNGESTLNLAGSLASGTPTGTDTGTTPTSTSGTVTSIPLTSTDRMIIAHGILCVIGFLFLLPLGGLVARYFRTSTNSWFKAHQIIQSYLAGPIIIVGWALGVAYISKDGGTHFDSPHTRLGLALFILYIVQVLIGNVIHLYKPKSALRRRPAQNYFHVVLGIVIIALSFYQVRTGYKDEYPGGPGRDALPKAADIIFYIWAVLVPVLYLAGLVFVPKQYKQEAASRMNKETNYEMRDGSRDS